MLSLFRPSPLDKKENTTNSSVTGADSTEKSDLTAGGLSPAPAAASAGGGGGMVMLKKKDDDDDMFSGMKAIGKGKGKSGGGSSSGWVLYH